jgi:predicted dehydrogenase
MLGGAAAIGAFPSIVRPQTVGRGGSAPSGRINVGIIGCGGIHFGHREHILSDPDLQLLWLCDVDQAHLDASRQRCEVAYADRAGTPGYNGIRTTRDFRELIADPAVDVVFICTPDHWHALTLITAANAGKDIYCEKPLSRAPAEGEAMVNAVQRAGVVCQIGSQQRSSPEFQRAIMLARNGYLGKIRRVIVGLPGGGGVKEIVQPVPQPIPENLDYEKWTGPSPLLPFVAQRLHFHWRWRYEYAGGQLTDWINHHYDIAQLVHGVNEQIPVAIRRVSGEFHDNPIYNTATRYSFDAHFAGGEVIEVSSDNRMGLRIEGESGWVVVDRNYIEHSSPTLRSLAMPSNGFVITGGASEHRKNFFACVRSRQTPRSPIDQAHKTAMAAHLANAALRAGLPEIRYDAQTKKISGAPGAERFFAANYRSPWHLPA